MRQTHLEALSMVAALLMGGCGATEPAPSLPASAAPEEQASPGAPSEEASEGSSEEPSEASSRERSQVPQAEASAEPPAEASAVSEGRCRASTSLDAAQPTWVASLAAAEGAMQRMISCETRARRPGPLDLYGRPTAVRCDPARVCSAGPDGAEDTDDDVCAPAQPGTPRPLPVERSMRPGCGSPAQAVLHFYASWLRGDDVYLEALAPRDEWGPGIETDVNAHRQVRIERVTLDMIRCTDETRCRFRVTVEIEGSAGGRVLGEVAASDGAWHISEIPG